jgi:hypothetical protein
MKRILWLVAALALTLASGSAMSKTGYMPLDQVTRQASDHNR